MLSYRANELFVDTWSYKVVSDIENLLEKMYMRISLMRILSSSYTPSYILNFHIDTQLSSI